jgi:hypothetical protein
MLLLIREIYLLKSWPIYPIQPAIIEVGGWKSSGGESQQQNAIWKRAERAIYCASAAHRAARPDPSPGKKRRAQDDSIGLRMTGVFGMD